MSDDLRDFTRALFGHQVEPDPRPTPGPDAGNLVPGEGANPPGPPAHAYDPKAFAAELFNRALAD